MLSFHFRKNENSGKVITTEAGAAKTDVVVRVGRRIVQIQGKQPGIGPIVPIAATDKAA